MLSTKTFGLLTSAREGNSVVSPRDSGRVETCRLFIAVSLPEPVKDEIESAQEELRGALSRDGVRWTKRVQFHLTLKFLGDVEPLRVDALTNALRLACQGFGVLSLRAGRIGVFPDLRRPRLIWVGVDDARERLPLLQRAVETAAAGFASGRPEGTFTGHVTLGRWKTIKRPQIDRLAKLAKAMENRQFGEWTADTVDLVRSESGPGGSRYTTLSAIPLSSADNFTSG
jgi:RNA 2',3'-cyclic 3'-phosphodiesterase